MTLFPRWPCTRGRRRLLLLAAAACPLLAGAATGVRADAPAPLENADPRTDMVRSLAALSPHVSLGEEARVFGRFVGSWDFDCVLFAADGATQRFPGRWTFGWVLDGRAMADVWIGYPGGLEAPDRGMGVSVRYYEPAAKAWRVFYIAPRSGTVVELRGGAEGDRIVLRGRDVDGSELRWSFHDIREDAFVWRGETSADAGKTWRLEQEMRLRRRR